MVGVDGQSLRVQFAFFIVGIISLSMTETEMSKGAGLGLVSVILIPWRMFIMFQVISMVIAEECRVLRKYPVIRKPKTKLDPEIDFIGTKSIQKLHENNNGRN